MGWYFAGAAAGVGARYLLNKHKQSQAVQQVEMAANQIAVTPISPPLPAEEWFGARGAFMFGVPRGFREQDPRTLPHQQVAPLVAIQGGGEYDGMWLAVVPSHLSVEIPPDRNPWIMVVLPDEYRQFISHWGATVSAGPVPVLLGGDRGIWSTLDAPEQGQLIRRYSVLTTHNGAPYEVLMGGPGLLQDQQVAKKYADAFWTAIGSWQWADHVSTDTASAIFGPPGSTFAGPASDNLGGGPTGPPGHAVLPPAGAASQPYPASSGGDSEYQLWAAENAITANAIAPPLPAERPFVVPDHFSFGLPSNFDIAPEPIVRAWQANWDSAPLIAVTDHAATEFSFLMAVFSGPSEVHTFNHLGSHSLWAAVVMGDEFRRTAEREFGGAVTQGPDAILVGGERGFYFGTKSVSNDGIEDRKWNAYAIHSYRCYLLMMFVLPRAETRYWDTFWTAIGTWQWEDA